MAGDQWVALGEVLRAHGIRGEVRVRLFNPESHAVVGGSELRLRSGRGDLHAVSVERARPVPGGGLILKLRGVSQREEAAALQGATIEVPRDVLPQTEEGEFYVCDLVGASVVGPRGPIGTVESVTSYPSADVLVVRTQDPKAARAEIPLVEDFVERIELEQRTIILREDALALLSE